jgi:putative LysE/RhtB family amino acid efflux pump
VGTLVLAGLGLGLVLAAQIGPVTLRIVRSVLRGGRAVVVGLAMAAAVAAVDVLYGTLGLAGFGHLAEVDGVRLVLGLASAAILVAIGVRTAWTGFRARLGLELPDDVVQPRRAFVTAVAATALNPLTIALWMVSFPALAPAAASASAAGTAAVLAGVAAGTLLWYSGFSVALALARSRIGPRLVAAVDIGTGGALIVFGGLLGSRAVDERG